jgi:hypothetical protein
MMMNYRCIMILSYVMLCFASRYILFVCLYDVCVNALKETSHACKSIMRNP